MAPAPSGKLRQRESSPQKTAGDPWTRLPALCHREGDTLGGFLPEGRSPVSSPAAMFPGNHRAPGAAAALGDGEFTRGGWHRAPGSQRSSSDIRLGAWGLAGDGWHHCV